MTAHRLESDQSAHNQALLVLWLGSAIAVGCAFGPAWLARCGVLVAIGSAIGFSALAWRELKRLNADHRRKVLAIEHAARYAAHRHHVESMDMITAFAARQKVSHEALSGLRTELAVAQADLSTLRGDLTAIRLMSVDQRARIAELEDSLSVREAELATLTSVEADDLVSLPIRVA